MHQPGLVWPFSCLSTGLKAFRQQLRKSTRTKGLLGLNKIKGLTRQVVPPPSCNRGSRGSLGPTLSEHRSMLEEVLHQQRYLWLTAESPKRTEYQFQVWFRVGKEQSVLSQIFCFPGCYRSSTSLSLRSRPLSPDQHRILCSSGPSIIPPLLHLPCLLPLPCLKTPPSYLLSKLL